MRNSISRLCLATSALVLNWTVQAHADRWHGGWGIGFSMAPPAPVYVAPPPPVYYAPPPVYYAPPPPVYYAPPPPPVVYAPPPAYSPGGLSLGVTIPVR